MEGDRKPQKDENHQMKKFEEHHDELEKKHQVQQALRESSEGVTLDLSMRKRVSTSPPRRASPSPYPAPPPGKSAPSPHSRSLAGPPEVLVYREAPPGAQAYYHAQDQSGRGKSPSMYVQDSRAPHLMMSRAAPVTLAPPPGHQTSKMQPVSGQPPPLTAKLVKGGSITHGTPVSGGQPQPNPQLLAPVPSARYEGLIRGQPKESGGSITQGTSLQQLHDSKRSTPAPPPNSYERHDVYKHRSSPPQQQFQPSYSPAPPPAAPSPYRAPYAMEQQLSTRQIIMNDYITSQQMVGRRGSAEKDPTARLSPRGASPHHPMYYAPGAANAMYPSNSPQRTPPPPQPQQTQGVIQDSPQPPPPKQMLMTQKASPPPQQRHTAYPPGHEAFSSLVDVASQQPSLPVPKDPQSGPPPLLHEGLGKGLVDAHLLNQQHKSIEEQEKQHNMLQDIRRNYVNYQSYNDFVKMKEHDKRLKELHHVMQQQQHQQHQQDLHQYNALQRQRERENHIRMQQEMRHNEMRAAQQAQQQNEMRQQNEIRQHEMRQNEIRQQHEIRQNEARHNEIRQQNELRAAQQQDEMRIQKEARRQNEIMQELKQQEERRQQARMMQHQLAAEEELRHQYQQSKEREAARLLVSNYQYPPSGPPSGASRSQAPPPRVIGPPPPQATPPPPRPTPPSVPGQQPQGQGQPGQDSSTMTAASLIHAIITHQINQSSEPEPSPAQLRPCDTLFQETGDEGQGAGDSEAQHHGSSSQPPPTSDANASMSTPQPPVPAAPGAESMYITPPISVTSVASMPSTSGTQVGVQSYVPTTLDRSSLYPAGLLMNLVLSWMNVCEAEPKSKKVREYVKNVSSHVTEEEEEEEEEETSPVVVILASRFINSESNRKSGSTSQSEVQVNLDEEHHLLSLLKLKFCPKRLLQRLLAACGNKQQQLHSKLFSQMHKVMKVVADNNDPPNLVRKMGYFTLRPSKIIQELSSQASKLVDLNFENCSSLMIEPSNSSKVLFLDAEFYSDQSPRWINVIDSEGVIKYEATVSRGLSGTTYKSLAQVQAVNQIDVDREQIPCLDIQNIRQNLKTLLNENSILCGHDLSHDLAALKLYHMNVIDTYHIFRDEDSTRRIRNLKALSNILLNRNIQQSSKHDPLEDNLATRDLLIRVSEQMFEVAKYEDFDAKEIEAAPEDADTGFISDLMEDDTTAALVGARSDMIYAHQIQMLPTSRITQYTARDVENSGFMASLHHHPLIIVVLHQSTSQSLAAVKKSVLEGIPECNLVVVKQTMEQENTNTATLWAKNNTSSPFI